MKQHPVVVYLAVAFGVSYAAWIGALLLPEGRSTYLYAGLSFFAMVGPLLGTLAVRRLGWKSPAPANALPRAKKLRAALQGVGLLYLILWIVQLGWQNALAGWLGAPSVALDAATLLRFTARTLFMPLFYLFAVFLEEYGWRYFLYTEMKKYGPWAAAWGVGFIWAVWHVPAAFVLGRGNAGWMILNYLVYVPALHQLLALYYDRSQSLWTSVALHAVFNGFGTAYFFTSGQMTRPDQMAAGDLRVTLLVNLGALLLLLPFSLQLLNRLRAEPGKAQPAGNPAMDGGVSP